MRKFFALMAVMALCAVSATAFAYVVPRANTVAPLGENAVPARAPDGYGRADTLHFGYYQVIGGNYYAVLGETWTWDHGAIDPLEGWTSQDQTSPQSGRTYVRRITSAIWGGHNNNVPAPILNGTADIWFGAYQDTGDSLCWELGLGYGNLWCQKLQSPDYHYSGSGDISLDFRYFNDT